MTPQVDIDTEAIPNELKARDQWLLWDKSANTPRRPHANGDFGISWNDPDDWLTFDAAREAAAAEDAWGVGYVFQIGNSGFDAGQYAALDIDGCLDEDQRPKEWLPSLQPLLDAGAYVEVSPSGTGLRIPLEGYEAPPWWSDSHFSDEEHEGVDVLENKFATITGDRIDPAGQTLAVDDSIIDEWLAAAYEVLNGEPPRDQGNQQASISNISSSRDDDYLDQEIVEDALSYIDPDVGYPTWRNVGFALQSHFSDRVALSLFKDWSRDGQKWDSDAERRAERIIRDATSSGGCTIGTVVYLAKQGGWEPPKPSGWRDREFSEAVRKTSDPGDDLSDADIWQIWSDERADGRLGEDSVIPTPALRHVAREHELYDFEPLDADHDELPPKAHNRALWHVENVWAEEHLGEDADATARRYKERDAVVFTWEDVRYVYDESAEDGRYAAVRLLRKNHEFLTPADTEELHMYRADLGVFEEGARYDIGLILDRELGPHYSQHEKNEILGRLKEDVVERDQLEASTFDATLVCVENGVLDIEARELRDHDSKYNFTTHLPVEYDSEAEAPRIREFLKEITHRDADAKTLLELLGNCLLPNYKHEYILFLFGEGANGKSTWLNVVRTFLGADNTTSLQLQKLSENRFATARLVGKWANIAEDLPAKKLHDTGTLKDLSGGGEIAAEKKGQDGFDFQNRAKLMFAANRPPVLGERTYAIQRRLAPIYLPYKFTEGDDEHKDRQKDILDELTTDAELSGLLNAALDGLDRLEENGDISLPETREERLELYEKHSDHIKAFRVDCLTNESGERVTKDEVYNAYTNFCEARDREPVGKRTFWKQLRKTTLNVTVRRLPEDDEGSRPRALDNVTFTETGEEYAPSFEARSDADNEADTEALALAARELGHGQTFTAEVATVSKGEYNREAQGQLRGPHGTVVGFVVPGGNENPLQGKQGDVLEFQNVTLRTDDDQLREVVINDAAVLEKSEFADGSSEGPAGSGDDSTQDVAADGGGDGGGEGKFEQLEPRVVQQLREGFKRDDTVTPAQVAGAIGESPEDVENILDRMASKGRVVRRAPENEGGFKMD